MVYGALKGAKIAVAACRMGMRGNFKNEGGGAIALSDHQKTMQPNGVVSPFHTSIVRYKSSVRVVRVVVVLFLQAPGLYAQARTSRRTRTSSKEESTRAHDHFAMFLHGSGSSASTLRRRSFPVHFTSYHYQR